MTAGPALAKCATTVADIGRLIARADRGDPEAIEALHSIARAFEKSADEAPAAPKRHDLGPPPIPNAGRSRRKRAIRPRTISMKRITQRELELGRILFPEADAIERPATRSECEGGARPCPFVSCKHHLYLDVSPRTGAIKLNFPDLEVGEMTETCALDVADRGGTTLEEVGAIMNLTRERIRQVERRGRAGVRAAAADRLRELGGVEEGERRHLPILDGDVESDVDGDALEDPFFGAATDTLIAALEEP